MLTVTIHNGYSVKSWRIVDREIAGKVVEVITNVMNTWTKIEKES